MFTGQLTQVHVQGSISETRKKKEKKGAASWLQRQRNSRCQREKQGLLCATRGQQSAHLKRMWKRQLVSAQFSVNQEEVSPAMITNFWLSFPLIQNSCETDRINTTLLTSADGQKTEHAEDQLQLSASIILISIFKLHKRIRYPPPPPPAPAKANPCFPSGRSRKVSFS